MIIMRKIDTFCVILFKNLQKFGMNWIFFLNFCQLIYFPLQKMNYSCKMCCMITSNPSHTFTNIQTVTVRLDCPYASKNIHNEKTWMVYKMNSCQFCFFVVEKLIYPSFHTFIDNINKYYYVQFIMLMVKQIGYQMIQRSRTG